MHTCKCLYTNESERNLTDTKDLHVADAGRTCVALLRNRGTYSLKLVIELIVVTMKLKLVVIHLELVVVTLTLVIYLDLIVLTQLDSVVVTLVVVTHVLHLELVVMTCLKLVTYYFGLVVMVIAYLNWDLAVVVAHLDSVVV